MNYSKSTQKPVKNGVIVKYTTVIKDTWSDVGDSDKWAPAQPRIDVHYFIPSTSTISKKTRKVVFASAPLVAVLILGIITGSFTVWQSRFGEANKLAQQEDANFSKEFIQPRQPWVKQLEFNQSELNVVAELLPELIEEYRHEPTAEELANEERKNKLRDYFIKRKSPFAKDDETIQAFLDSKNMKLMIAISFVESTMGKRCYYNNCSGIGGYPPDLRKYDSYALWIKDFDSLLERRYKDIPIEKFMGLYVQPGSPNWINGVKQILAELQKDGIE